MISRLKSKIKHLMRFHSMGKILVNDSYHIIGNEKSKLETKKRPFRFDVINELIKYLDKDISYLEIGVRNPKDNFDKINAINKFSVDPGLSYKENPVQFKMTSDTFFQQIKVGKILNEKNKFDIVFIDGLHLADQVERDIHNSLSYLSDDGFIVLHDCNPPTEFHARETYAYSLSPAKDKWNGTTWKAFFKFRQKEGYYSCCIDSDWGVGVISKSINFGKPTQIHNPYFEFKILEENRTDSLNLMSYEQFLNFLN